jgi:hypothetical protein
VWKIHADLPGFLTFLQLQMQGIQFVGSQGKQERVFCHPNECGTERAERVGVISV